MGGEERGEDEKREYLNIRGALRMGSLSQSPEDPTVTSVAHTLGAHVQAGAAMGSLE